uniref:aminoglycoside phosphotransferase family protein n=1 Tax=Acetatifactor sp. TaxID=1872090 RepID=UPI004057C393
MEHTTLFENILTALNLGSFTAMPQRVSGGYMHKMYKLETTTGTYAVKLLNPSIMKRPDAMENYKRAEQLETVLEANHLPIVPALCIKGQKMHCIDGQYCYLFTWTEGKALDWHEINAEHCKIAGTLLAKIHKLEQTAPSSTESSFTDEDFRFDWDAYIALANEKCPEIAKKLQSNRNLLYLAQQEYNSAMTNVPAISCICDGDMDSKNVLWVDGEPLIIDLECLDYGNPFTEMFQLALSWAGGVLCDIDFERLGAFIRAYSHEYGTLNIDLKSLYGIGFSWLDWLEYNVKRALMIECENEEEQKLGIGQVHETLGRIIYYHSVKDELLKQLPTAQ